MTVAQKGRKAVKFRAKCESNFANLMKQIIRHIRQDLIIWIDCISVCVGNGYIEVKFRRIPVFFSISPYFSRFPHIFPVFFSISLCNSRRDSKKYPHGGCVIYSTLV